MGSAILSPSIGALSYRGKVVIPSQPPQPPAPWPSSVAGGSLPLRTYYLTQTWNIQTQDGAWHESTPSNEVAFEVPANELLKVPSPGDVPMPYALMGWSLYAAEAAGEEGRQNAAPIAIGTDWAEPGSGLVAGAPAPSAWGSESIFKFPPRNQCYYTGQWHGHDERSTSGGHQSITWYVDELVDFDMPWIENGDDAAAWKQFLQSAVWRVPFDFYQDSTLADFQTLVLTDANPGMPYKAANFYQSKLKARKVIVNA